MIRFWNRWTLLVFLPWLGATAPAWSQLDRHAQWTKKAAAGPHAEVVAGTLWGSDATEEVISGLTLQDGRILVIGNSWGPQFPDQPPARLIGKDGWQDLPLHEPGMETDKSGQPQPPAANHPNRSGFLTIWQPDLSRIDQSIRFGFGVASITAALRLSDGGVVISGRSGTAFRHAIEAKDPLHIFPKTDDKNLGPVEFAGVQMPGDGFVVKFNADLSHVEWAWIFEGHHRTASMLWEAPGGEVVLDLHGVKRIHADGSQVTPVSLPRPRGSWIGAVSPKDGTIAVIGDHQSPTGQEPWRKPILMLFTPEGKLIRRLYDWDGPLVGHARWRLVSDSAVRLAQFSPDGHLSLSIWSDGGNSVATRNPIDLERKTESAGMGMDMWGANVGSFVHLVRFDPTTCDRVSYTLWASYLKEKPNSIWVDGMMPLRSGGTALFGRAATWLVQTPNAVFQSTDRPSGGRGNYVTLFSPDFQSLWFSSALAPARTRAVTEVEDGLIVLSTALGESDESNNRLPTPNSLQSSFAGGFSDVHLFKLKLPQGTQP